MDSANKQINRRDFINLTAGGIAATALITPLVSLAGEKTKIKAIAFDAFPIFDPRPVFQLVNDLFPDKGAALTNTWRTTQFEYTWLYTSASQYNNFWKITEDALTFAAKKNGIELTAPNRKLIMDAYLHLNAWSDVLPALESLKQKGIRLALLSNFTTEMLNSCIKTSKLDGYFEAVLSVDKVKRFKPSPTAYQMGINAFSLKKQEIAFAAFAGWDAAGAKWFGYPTYWVNRQDTPLDELGVRPDGTGNGLAGLVDFVSL